MNHGEGAALGRARAIAGGLAAAILMSAAPGAGHATTLFGSAVYVTGRDCGTKSATQACAGPGTTLTYTDIEGGPNQSVDIYDTDGQNLAQAKVSFGGQALPVIGQSDAAAPNLRVNINTFAFNSFTYTGDAPIELSYAGDLHIVGSSGAPLGSPDFAGGAGYFAWVAIWDTSLIAGFNGPGDAFSQGYGNYDCSTAGVLGYAQVGGALSGGEQFIHIATAGCGGGPVMINPGQTILAAEFLQTPVNRGGFVDASHTFRMTYDPELPIEVQRTLAATMDPGVAGVPEPATWACMLLGFFGTGAMLRRRPRAPSPVTGS